VDLQPLWHRLPTAVLHLSGSDPLIPSILVIRLREEGSESLPLPLTVCAVHGYFLCYEEYAHVANRLVTGEGSFSMYGLS